jgi:membrane protease YdiL (CAAX protease family)
MIEDSVPILIKGAAPATRSKRRDLVEILTIYGMVLIIFWTPPPWQNLLWCVAAASIAAIIFNSLDSFNQAGMGRGSLSCSLWAVAAALLVAAIAVTLAGRMHTLHLPGTPGLFLERTCIYAVWASIQQLVLQRFFLSRLLHVLGDSTWAAAAAAMLFAAAHLPSPILTLVTLVCGLAACIFFLRYRSLYPLAIAHFILGVCIAITVPGPVDHNMRVGLAYLTYAEKSAPLANSTASPQP